MNNTEDTSVLSEIRNASSEAIEASAVEIRKRARLETAIRVGAKRGVDVDALSEASGLPPKSIHTILDRTIGASEDVAVLMGEA